MLSFVSDKDIEELKKQDIDYDVDIKIFLMEFRDFFNKTWTDEHYIKNEIADIEELNRDHLENFPSWGGHYILESSFTGSNDIEILSEKTKGIIGYFYGIHLR